MRDVRRSTSTPVVRSGSRRGAPALLASLVALVLTASGCSASNGSAASSTEDSPAPAGPSSAAAAGPLAAEPSESAPTAAAPPATTEPSSAGTSLTLQFGDLEIRATLEDSAASRSLLAQLPATLDFSDYGGQEKIATLPAPLDLTGVTDRAAAPAGTLGYYAPDQGLVLYYESVGAYSGIVPLGVFDGIDALRDASDGAVDIRVE